MSDKKMSPWYPTTDQMHLRRLGKLLEELGELSAVAARCIIQGIDEIDPSTGQVNRDRLHDEMADVYAQLNVAAEDFGINADTMRARVDKKERWMREWDELVS